MMQSTKLFVFGMVLFVNAAWAVPPQATEQADVLKMKGDVKRGEEAYEVCSACHLADGMGRDDGSLPVVSSQHAKVLVKQMVDIRTGKRENPTMYPFASSMKPSELADVAAYMASLELKPTNGKGPGANLKRGEELYKKDCQTCHGAKGEGDEVKFIPMLTGQHYKYMFRQMQEMHEGKRKNADKEMLKVIKPYNAADLDAVTDFISRLDVAGKKKK